jgi:2-C-methyl-D-erythritol 4-phosphate cytidylyltransferase
VVHAVRALAAAEPVTSIVVAAPPDDIAYVRGLLASVQGASVSVVAGGATRAESVVRALKSLAEDVDVVLVHDAARPLTPVALVEAVDAAVRSGHVGVVPGLPVPDTIKSVDAAGLAGGAAGSASAERVAGTVDRTRLRAVQTPQGFRRDVLEAAYAAAEADGALDATDDAGLVERVGHPVVVVPGEELAFKVTRPIDLVLADAVLSARQAAHHGGEG